jgi:Zn-dependent protease
LNLSDTIYTASTWIVPILIAITFHEAAHAYAAWKLGDDTAHRLGRVTFNPFKHVDLFGTILLPALLFLTNAPFLFGWAKPVPVAFGRLGHPRRDMAFAAPILRRPCCAGRTADEFGARLHIGGSPSDCTAAA